MDVTAKAIRSGDWWAIEVPEIPGLFTQAKRLDQVEEMVVDAAAMLGHDDVTVTVAAELDEDDARVVDDARERSRRLVEAEAQAAAASRAAIARLRDRGLPMRDVAKLMGVSTQRVSQIGKAMQVSAKTTAAFQKTAKLGAAQRDIVKTGQALSKLSSRIVIVPNRGGGYSLVKGRSTKGSSRRSSAPVDNPPGT